jgi:hypothetical protein
VEECSGSSKDIGIGSRLVQLKTERASELKDLGEVVDDS